MPGLASRTWRRHCREPSRTWHVKSESTRTWWMLSWHWTSRSPLTGSCWRERRTDWQVASSPSTSPNKPVSHLKMDQKIEHSVRSPSFCLTTFDAQQEVTAMSPWTAADTAATLVVLMAAAWGDSAAAAAADTAPRRMSSSRPVRPVMAKCCLSLRWSWNKMSRLQVQLQMGQNLFLHLAYLTLNLSKMEISLKCTQHKV